jgi:hypothetical protein
MYPDGHADALWLGVLTLAAWPSALANVPRQHGRGRGRRRDRRRGDLADPRRRQGRGRGEQATNDKKPQQSGGTVPADVFDRLDERSHSHPAPIRPPAPAPEP